MARARKPKKKKRPPLPIASKPSLIVANGDGVEALAMRAALACDWPVLGYVPRGHSGSALRPGTLSDHPLQAVKWNARAADLTIVVTASAALHGRAQWATRWAQRYRKPTLHWWPGNADTSRLHVWLTTYRWRSVHITGAAAHQLGRAADLIELLIASIQRHACGRVIESSSADHGDVHQTEEPH